MFRRLYMKILIVGGGTVGAAICHELSEEGHDITIIDKELTYITELSNVCDVFGVVGSGADVAVLRKADAGKCDLVIAVTSSDEINLLCCSAARKLGAKHTIARVRNPEYSELMVLMKNDMNLSMTINPELAAAEAIYRMLRYPSAAKVETFYRGKVEIVEFALPSDSPICNKTLFEIRSALKCKFLVCGVLRDDVMHVPAGDFVLKAGDVIGVTAPDGELTKFFKAVGIFKQPIRDLLVIGGGKVTYYLEQLLVRGKIASTVIESNKALCYDLSEKFNCTVVCEDGTKQEVLLEAGIEKADAFLALLDRDEQNAIMSLYAKTCKVPKIISLIKELSYVDFYKGMGLESIISPKSITASDILRYVRAMSQDATSEIESLHKIMGDKAEALEFTVKSEIEGVTDIPLKELRPKAGILIACIIHQNKIIIPSGDDSIKIGDTVLIVTTVDDAIDSMKDILP